MSEQGEALVVGGAVDVATLRRIAEIQRVQLVDVLAQTDAVPLGVPGARAIYWKDLLWHRKRRDFLSPAELGERLAALDLDVARPLVVFSAVPQYGFYSRWALRYAGHTQVLVLEGARGLQSPLPEPTGAGRVVVKSEGSSSRVLRNEVLAALGDAQIQIVDARSQEEYDGLRVSPPGHANDGAERAGHIPGAIHLPYLDLLGADGVLKPQAELSAAVQRRGLRADKPVIAYCRLSHRASLLTYVLQERLGFADVRLYDGSWTEWGSAVGLPID
jgi:thiosulfate/3-mercaptopyruvate sulfurtransferase